MKTEPNRDGCSRLPALDRTVVMCGLAAALLVIGAMAHGCAAEAEELTEEQALARLQRDIDRVLPRTWQVGTVEQANAKAGLELEGEGLVAWRTEPVELRQRDADGEPVEATLHFHLQQRPWIEPADFREIYRENEALRQRHRDVLRMVRHIPRNVEGELMPRDQNEQAAVSRFRAAYEQLPDYRRDLPTHRFRGVALTLHDERTEIIPAERELQTEKNTVYAQIANILTAYR